MSKMIKDLVRKELVKRFTGLDSMAVVDLTGVDAVTNHKIRSRLLAKSIHLTVVKNALARQAFKEIGLDVAGRMLEGPSALAYGADGQVGVVTIVRELLDMVKDAPNLTVKAALLEGEIFGKDRIEELSKFPTREEAVAQVVQVLLSPGGRLVGCLAGPGGKLASAIKSIEDKQKGSETQAA